MNHPSNGERRLLQRLHWGDMRQERLSAASTMFANTGRRLYVLGDIDGRFRPRSNPYDLHAFGKPRPDDPLAEKLQGVWAQPVKGLAGYSYSLTIDGDAWNLLDADTFTQAFAYAEFSFRRVSLKAVRHDFAAQDLPLLLSSLRLQNDGVDELNIALTFTAAFDLQDAWFTHLAGQRNTGQQISIEDGCLVARAEALPEQWAVVVGASRSGGTARLLNDGRAALDYHLRLAPGTEETLTFGIAIESQGGPQAGKQILALGLANSAALLDEKIALYDRLLARGPRLSSPDPALNEAFDLALANIQLLEAESDLMGRPPRRGRYFYAGLEMFPFWFSNDGAYSLPGLMAGGFTDTALNHSRLGLEYLQDGRVPHQISPSGEILFAGNAQETPQWVSSLWEAYRWTGDRGFLSAVYPGAVKGMFDYVLGTIDPDGDGYPSGPGMVEVESMGAEKLDSAAYTWAALQALAEMAAELGDAATEQRARQQAARIQASFNHDWWDAANGTYAMSLDESNQIFPVPHWAVIVPLEVGLAASEHAAATFTALRARYLNRWGMKHTAGDDERVWTLPTATLSRAAYRYGEAALGYEMLRRVAETLDHGSIGLFHELIPEGACIVQLWSAAVFLRGIVEDLLGIQVLAADNILQVTPNLPQGWDVVELKDLSFGQYRVSLRIEPGRLGITSLEGAGPLQIRCSLPVGGQVASVKYPHWRSEMSFEITLVPALAPVTVLTTHGDIDASNYQELIRLVRQLYQGGVRDLLLDLGDTVYLSSSGMVALHSIALLMNGGVPLDIDEGWSALRTMGFGLGSPDKSHFKLLNVHQRVDRTLQISGLKPYYPIYTDLEVALASFNL